MARRRTHRRLRAGLVALFVVAFAGPAAARTTVVPDDFPTIQAAVDAIPEFAVGETLLVRGGSYPEKVRIARSLVVLAIPALDGSDRMPEIGGLAAGGDGAELVFVGLRFTRHAYDTSYGPDNLVFRDCRFDADFGPRYFGVLDPDTNSLRFTRCTFMDTTVVGAWIATIDSCTVRGMMAVVGIDRARILDNRFEDIPTLALLLAYTRDGMVARNQVRGCYNAFQLFHGDVRVEDNVIEDCRGDGISSGGQYGSRIYIERNRVVRCRTGIHPQGVSTVRGNVVTDCALLGIYVIQGQGAGIIEDNVVGRCGGPGIILRAFTYQYGVSTFDVRGNTVYACNGPALAVENLHPSTVTNNIFYACLGSSQSGSDPLVMSHNDWYPAHGAPLSPTDVSVDPRFCDIANNDVRLMSDSPLLHLPGVGRIGALGMGCEAPTVTFGFEMWPRVLAPDPRTRWITAWLEPPVPFSVAAIDIGTVRVNDVAVADGSPPLVGDEDRDGIPDLQLRFDRAALERTLETGDRRTVTLTGRVGGRLFAGSDEIRVLRHGGPPSSVPRSTPRVLSIQAPSTGVATGSLRVAFTLVDEAPARIEVLDVAGRVIASREVGGRASAESTVEFAGPGFSPGIYFLRLRQGVNEARTRCVVMR
jgi:hypothetical protein